MLKTVSYKAYTTTWYRNSNWPESILFKLSIFRKDKLNFIKINTNRYYIGKKVYTLLYLAPFEKLIRKLTKILKNLYYKWENKGGHLSTTRIGSTSCTVALLQYYLITVHCFKWWINFKQYKEHNLQSNNIWLVF